MALFEDGTRLGTIGGGAIEQDVIEALRSTLSSAQPQSHSRHLTRDLAMCCGGQMSFFIEPIFPSPRLVLFGAGHIAQPLGAMAQLAGFEVIVVDEREELNEASRFPGCAQLLDDGDGVIRSRALRLGERDYVVVCTHSHQLDERLVTLCASFQVEFLGMVGSRRKSETVRKRIFARNPQLDLSHLVSPVGLPLGAVEPEEIAVSILAQIVRSHRARVGSKRKSAGDVVGVILAAGAASRLGQNKALGRIGTTTVLSQVRQTLLDGGCEEVCVVVAPPHDAAITAALPSYWYARAPHASASMLDSFRIGQEAASTWGASYLVLATLDQPRISADTVRSAIERARETKNLIIPTSCGRRGHPVCMPAQVELAHSVDNLRDALRLALPLETFETDDPGVLDNLNTQEDATKIGVSWPVRP